MPETVGKLDQILMIMSYYHLDNPHTAMFVWVNFVVGQHSLNLEQFFQAPLSDVPLIASQICPT